MAYPMAPMPTFEEFLRQLMERYEIPLVDYGAVPNLGHIRYVEKTIGGRIVSFALQEFQPNERVTPNLIRAVCARFGLDPADFGFPLTEPRDGG